MEKVINHIKSGCWKYCCFCLLTIMGCYQNNIDCTDPFAVNFNPLADENCKECCENPKIKLVFKHLRDSFLYRSTDTFRNKFDQLYKLEDIQYYISGFRIVNSQDISVVPEDNISYNNNKGQIIVYPDDHKIIRTNAVEYTLYGVRASGEFKSLRFRIGWDSLLSNASTINVPESHPLSEKVRLKDNEDKALSLSLKLIHGLQFKDTTNIFILATQTLEPIFFEYPIIIQKGVSPIFTVTASYEKWFFDTDLTKSEEDVKSKFSGNIGKAFSVN